jgi:hypothetical protein
MRRAIVIAVVAVVALATVGVALAATGAINRNEPTPHQVELRAQVQDRLGQPRAGRDPAVQRQVSLREAARQKAGIAARGGKPAAKLHGGHERVDPAEVLPDTKRTGVLASGCAAGYGQPGDQCLPARAPNDKPVTCAYVVQLFPAGLRVTGRDRLGLDTSGDGLACGHGDAGVPPGAHAHHEHP